MYLVIWLLNGMRKGIERASGIEEVRKLGNGEGVMPSVPWAPKRSRDRAQRDRAAGKVSAVLVAPGDPVQGGQALIEL